MITLFRSSTATTCCVSPCHLLPHTALAYLGPPLRPSSMRIIYTSLYFREEIQIQCRYATQSSDPVAGYKSQVRLDKEGREEILTQLRVVQRHMSIALLKRP